MSLFQNKPTDQELINGIRLGGLKRQRFENNLYEKYRYLIRDATRKHKIAEEEASIAYSDTILTSIENISTGRFEGRSELKTYIYQIFSNKCVDAMRRNTTKGLHRLSLDEVLEPIPDPQRSIIQELIRKQNHEKLRRLLATLGDRCQALLNRWADGYSDQESANTFAYNSAGVVQTTRLRCLEKLRELYKTAKEN
jgi:RNA polymerase sigma factor (sigma-70 family)